MPESNQPTITLDHLRRLGLCAKGARQMVVNEYGKEVWRRLVRGGIPVDEARDIQHPDVQAAVKLAIEEFNGK